MQIIHIVFLPYYYEQFVVDKPTVHIEEGSQLILTEGDNLVLTCNFSCYPDLHKLEWKHMSYIVDKMNTKYGSTRRLEISKVRNNHSGAFICKVTNEVGAGYAKINITVQCKYVINVIFSKNI